MPVLESIAAATAAYDIILKALGQGRETAGLLNQIGKFLAAEEDIKESYRKKKNSPLASITGGSEEDWEEFAALEQIKEQRRELESWCRIKAPSGTWDRWLAFEAEARKRRAEARKAAEKRREERMEQIQMATAIILAITSVVVGVWWLGVYLEKW